MTNSKKTNIHIWGKTITLFSLFFILFISIHLFFPDSFLGRDPYYHAKHAEIMLETNNLTIVQPWLEFHYFKTAPCDTWWGFHVINAFFIKIWGTMLGTKIFVSALSALIFACFYYVLKKLKTNYTSFWLTLLLLSSNTFFLRTLLERPLLFSITALILTYYFLIKKKHLSIFLLTTLFVLMYEMFIITSFTVFIFLIVERIKNKTTDYNLIIWHSLGLLVGFILHPNSINYLKTTLIQIFKVLYLKISFVDLGVAGEINISNFIEFLANNVIIIFVSLVSFACFYLMFRDKKTNLTIWLLFVLSVFWLITTLFMRRAIDYWLPTVILFSAMFFTQHQGSNTLKKIFAFTKKSLHPKIVIFFLIFLFSIQIYSSYTNLTHNLDKNNTTTTFQDLFIINTWLKANTKNNSIVFYDNWDLWPLMFFQNDHNHYIAGMDPTFLYDHDKKLFWIWKNISYKGQYCETDKNCQKLNPTENINKIKMALRQNFNSNYIISYNNETSLLYPVLKNYPDFFSETLKTKSYSLFVVN